MQNKDRIVVVFRKWLNPSRDIIALFPLEPSDVAGIYCMSYEHFGQHGSADYTAAMLRTVTADPEEYAELKAELEKIGYDLDVRRRCPKGAYQIRLAAARPARIFAVGGLVTFLEDVRPTLSGSGTIPAVTIPAGAVGRVAADNGSVTVIVEAKYAVPQHPDCTVKFWHCCVRRTKLSPV